MKKLRIAAISYLVIFAFLYSLFAIFHFPLFIFEEHSSMSIIVGALLFTSILIFIATSKKDR